MRIQNFDYSVNLLQAILWQYDQSKNLLSLLNQKQEWYDENQTQFWVDWYNNVFNLQTANRFGLSLWSYILNVPLYVSQAPEPDNKPLWGFNQITGAFPSLLNTYLNFGNSNFSTRGKEIMLTLEEQRFLLRLRYFQLTTSGSITDINVFLNYLTSTSDIGYSGYIAVLDGLNMSMRYVFSATDFPEELLQTIIDLDIFPRPAGVGLSYYTNYGNQFGFNEITSGPPNILENTNLNFENGNFVNTLRS